MQETHTSLIDQATARLLAAAILRASGMSVTQALAEARALATLLQGEEEEGDVDEPF